MSRTVACVDGLDGSGKSRFAAALARACTRQGLPVVLLAVDDFRRPVDWASGDEADLYWERYFDLAALDDLLAAALRGAPEIIVPAFDSGAERAAPPGHISVPDRALLLVEGVFVRRLAAAPDALHIYLRAGLEEASRRILARDRRKGRSEDEVRRRMAARYFPCQERYIAAFAPERAADVLVDNEDPARPSLLRASWDLLPEELAGAVRDVVNRGD